MKYLNVAIFGHPEPAKRVTRRSLWRAKDYAAWKAKASALIRSEARGRKMETPIHFVGWIYGNSMRADVDNYLKACLDACVLSGIIPNDNCKHVQSARIYFLKEAKEKEQVIMEVESL